MQKLNPVQTVNNVFKVKDNKGEWVDYQLTEPHKDILMSGWLGNRNKTKRLINKGRQAGYSTFIGIEAIVLAHKFPGSDQYYIATNADQASDWLKDNVHEIARHAKPTKNGAQLIKYDEKNSTKLNKKFKIPITDEKGDVIRHETSNIEGLPASSSGIRGKTALNVILDEFDHVDQTKDQKREIYNAVKDFVNQGGQMTIQTTPKDRTGLFWQDYQAAKKGMNLLDHFYCPVVENWKEIDLDIPFFVDLENDHRKFVKKFMSHKEKFDYDEENEVAYRSNLDIPYPWIDVKSLEEDRRKSIPDFKQEKLGVPTRGESSFIKPSLYDEQIKYQDERKYKKGMRVEAALDVAQQNDISALTIADVSKDYGERSVDELAIRKSQEAYPEQEKWLERVYNEYPFQVIYIDNTGVGRSLADYIEQNRNIRARVHRVQYQGKIEHPEKEDEKIRVQEFMAESFKRALQQNKYRMLRNEEAKGHVTGVVKTQTPAGYLKYGGKKSDAGRDDHFWSKAQLAANWDDMSMPRFGVFKNNTTSKRKSRTGRSAKVKSGGVTW